MTTNNELRVVEDDPFNAETPLHVLAEPVTPIDSFFVRSNFAVPRIDTNEWRLSVAGLVGNPLSISLRELMSLGETDVTSVMECAGNGRQLMSPRPEGTPWGLGAVSAGVFTGVPLSEVLAMCVVDARAVEIVFRGADSGALDDGRHIHFERSLPIARAKDPTTLLVWAMNGEPLTPAHGHPVRLFVPGYYGVASVKWLERIEAVDTPFAGHFQAERYVYVGHPTHADNVPVTRMHVRSLIASPAEGDTVSGTITVRGSAWSGNGDVTRVQVSGDGGATWLDAHLRSPPAAHAPTLWSCEFTPSGAGNFVLMSRATDSSGEVQPMEQVWNALGYANNVVQRVALRCE